MRARRAGLVFTAFYVGSVSGDALAMRLASRSGLAGTCVRPFALWPAGRHARYVLGALYTMLVGLLLVPALPDRVDDSAAGAYGARAVGACVRSAHPGRSRARRRLRPAACAGLCDRLVERHDQRVRQRHHFHLGRAGGRGAAAPRAAPSHAGVCSRQVVGAALNFLHFGFGLGAVAGPWLHGAVLTG